MKLNERETATVLAALRYWQQDLIKNGPENCINEEHFSDMIEPLTPEEIDGLCERINCEDAAIDLLQSAIDQWAGRFDSEEDINGADAVDWLADFVEQAKSVLEVK